MTYCQAVQQMDADNPNVYYHDYEYGFPLTDDDELFGRLILEINQAGLSWITILKKKDNFRTAYSGFSIEQVASYGENDRGRLLNDAGIIRNRLKVDATIYNAQQILLLQQEYGSFKNWLDQHHPKTKEEWVKLFKKHFKFVGGEIVNEFLMSTGYLPGAHEPSCPIFAKIKELNPAWMKG
ncbi:DNA-3-methyladenine glycosylase I [Tunicatimonas pelagia]|uniref:DNA-3-methyladenine glycosylase I n=1 Tax=Tunicatimonas pelagia TaxID=931531 RepID=UPI002666A765|nr:DNA-3-methyladenine glycosylase I [Tunicatimonas pelagia]WKN45711.1 DNA-3-methyladenine glycosylase I [Tunicatimonas pelagia]